MPLSKDGMSVIKKKINIKCDCLAMTGGWTPAVHLFTQSGGKLKFREEDQVFLPNVSKSKQISIGSSNGDFKLNEIIKNLLINVKNFLEIKTTEYDNLNIECPSDNIKKIYGYFHQIKLLEKQNLLWIFKMMQLQKILN